ncbi:ABC transporter permease [Asanoa sp. NPDC049573]|uniref:ABC transporter permease n=1 Tax=Asanoa sp. NPDC049573 TaxID=3155396 RepID=UPI00342A48FC
MTSSDRGDLPFPLRIPLLATRDLVINRSGWVAAWSMPIRAIFQAAFVILAGTFYAGNAGRDYAFVGAVAFAASPWALGAVSDAMLEDRNQGTIYRLRLGRLPMLALVALRTPPYLAQGLIAMVLGALVAGPILVGGNLAQDVVQVLPILATGLLSMLCMGLAIGSTGGSPRTDILLSNLAQYLILLAAGVILPPGRLPLLDAIGQVLPLRHALAAAHSWLAGRPDWSQLGLELLVAAVWLAAAEGCLTVQALLARRYGLDDLS